MPTISAEAVGEIAKLAGHLLAACEGIEAPTESWNAEDYRYRAVFELAEQLQSVLNPNAEPIGSYQAIEGAKLDSQVKAALIDLRARFDRLFHPSRCADANGTPVSFMTEVKEGSGQVLYKPLEMKKGERTFADVIRPEVKAIQMLWDGQPSGETSHGREVESGSDPSEWALRVPPIIEAFRVAAKAEPVLSKQTQLSLGEFLHELVCGRHACRSSMSEHGDEWTRCAAKDPTPEAAGQVAPNWHALALSVADAFLLRLWRAVDHKSLVVAIETHAEAMLDCYPVDAVFAGWEKTCKEVRRFPRLSVSRFHAGIERERVLCRKADRTSLVEPMGLGADSATTEPGAGNMIHVEAIRDAALDSLRCAMTTLWSAENSESPEYESEAAKDGAWAVGQLRRAVARARSLINPHEQRLAAIFETPAAYAGMTSTSAHFLALELAQLVLKRVWMAADQDSYAAMRAGDPAELDLQKVEFKWKVLSKKLLDVSTFRRMLNDEKDLFSVIKKEAARLQLAPSTVAAAAGFPHGPLTGKKGQLARVLAEVFGKEDTQTRVLKTLYSEGHIWFDHTPGHSIKIWFADQVKWSECNGKLKEEHKGKMQNAS